VMGGTNETGEEKRTGGREKGETRLSAAYPSAGLTVRLKHGRC
jgi:hypothetical protein